jgi:hypothetical protein
MRLSTQIVSPWWRFYVVPYLIKYTRFPEPRADALRGSGDLFPRRVPADLALPAKALDGHHHGDRFLKAAVDVAARLLAGPDAVDEVLHRRHEGVFLFVRDPSKSARGRRSLRSTSRC